MREKNLIIESDKKIASSSENPQSEKDMDSNAEKINIYWEYEDMEKRDRHET